MSKILFLIVVTIVLFTPVVFLSNLPPTHVLISANITSAEGGKGLVGCDGPSDCNFDAFKGMLTKIYELIKNIAAPLATIAFIVGGILMMVSAGNPNLMSKGKTIFWSGVIGLVLVFASQAIINFILGAIGAPKIS